MPSDVRLVLDIWSDYVCPFCYLELPEVRRLEERFPGRLEIVWRAFELRPEPYPTLDPQGDYLQDTWQRSVYPMAAERGLEMKLPPLQPRSRLALETAAYARGQDRFDAAHAALFRAFFEQGRDIGAVDVLCEIGAAAGLDADDLRAALEQGRFTAEVLADQRQARELRIGGVPNLILRAPDTDWRQGVSLQGAVPYARLEAAVGRLLS